MKHIKILTFAFLFVSQFAHADALCDVQDTTGASHPVPIVNGQFINNAFKNQNLQVQVFLPIPGDKDSAYEIKLTDMTYAAATGGNVVVRARSSSDAWLIYKSNDSNARGQVNIHCPAR